MRRSKPGIRNRKSDSPIQVKGDKIQHMDIPPHDPDWDMQYGCSRKTGDRAGGCFWNPPAFCEMRILTYGGERWVQVSQCKQSCPRWHSKTCEAPLLDKIQYVNGLPYYDEPKIRKAERRNKTAPPIQKTSSKRRS